MRTTTLIFLFAGSLGLAAWADAPRYIAPESIPPAADSNFVERVVAPRAVWATVSVPARMLVVSHAAGADKHLSLFALDETGRPTGAAPVSIVLPKPASLAAYTSVVASVVAHPTLPVLYVLQDIPIPQKPSPADPRVIPAFHDLDRLLMYKLEPGRARLVASGHGDRFFYGQHAVAGLLGAPLGLDADNRRLYLPNLRDPSVAKGPQTAVGYLALDEHGLPAIKDGKMTPTETRSTFKNGYPIGLGWVPVSGDLVIFGAYQHIVTWNMANRRAPLTFKVCGPDWGAQLEGHPTLPMLYRVLPTQKRLMAMELVDGYPTLFPQELSMPYCYRPQVLAKRNQLAVGRKNQLLLIGLDADGKFTTDVTSIAIANFGGNALCYSAPLDRLYVAVEKAP